MATTKGWLQKAGREAKDAVGALATTFSVMQRCHLFRCSCHRFIQIPEIHKDKCIISFCDRSAVKDAVKAVYCGTVAWLNLCNSLVPQAVHTQSYNHWIYSCKWCGHCNWRVREWLKAIHSVPLVSQNDSLMPVVWSPGWLWCHDSPLPAPCWVLHICRVIHPAAVASSPHVLPAAYIWLIENYFYMRIKWEAYLWEAALFHLSNTAGSAQIMDDYGAWDSGTACVFPQTHLGGTGNIAHREHLIRKLW